MEQLTEIFLAYPSFAYMAKAAAQRALSKIYCARYRAAHPDRIKISQDTCRIKNHEAYKACQRRVAANARRDDPEKCRRVCRESRHKCKNEDPSAFQIAKKNSELKTKYGITFQDYAAMQRNSPRCPGCSILFDASSRLTTACVDHDHTTGKIRGLLCMRCNSAVGYAKDDPKILQSLIAYLNKTKEINAR